MCKNIKINSDDDKHVEGNVLELEKSRTWEFLLERNETEKQK